jgi:hypothetical protein
MENNDNVYEKYNTNCVIVAKGTTDIYLKKHDYPNTLLIAVNQACKLIDKPDVVVMNDIESLFGLQKEDIKNIKQFYIPEYPHMKARATFSVTHQTFKNKVNAIVGEDYSDRFKMYNLHTSPRKNTNLPSFQVAGTSSGHQAIIIAAQLFNAKKIITYGFCKGSSYHSDILKLFPDGVDLLKNNVYSLYNNHSNSEKQLQKICKTYNIIATVL